MEKYQEERNWTKTLCPCDSALTTHPGLRPYQANRPNGSTTYLASRTGFFQLSSHEINYLCYSRFLFRTEASQFRGSTPHCKTNDLKDLHDTRFSRSAKWTTYFDMPSIIVCLGVYWCLCVARGRMEWAVRSTSTYVYGGERSNFRRYFFQTLITKNDNINHR